MVFLFCKRKETMLCINPVPKFLAIRQWNRLQEERKPTKTERLPKYAAESRGSVILPDENPNEIWGIARQ
jgi:hypothetical protein